MKVFYSVAALATMCFADAYAIEVDRRLPDEYETVPGYGLAMANSGAAVPAGAASVRTNPALIGVDRVYAFTGGFYWPTSGRDFYNAGVVDSQSSKVAAAFNYQGFTDEYQVSGIEDEKDSPVVRRAHLALAQNVGNLALGIGGHYLESQSIEDPYGEQQVRGTAINFGLAGMLSPRIRFGLSAENIANKKIAAYAPRTFRTGLAYLISNDISVQVDLRQRDRVASMEQSIGTVDIVGIGLNEDEQRSLEAEDKRYEKPERMAFGSFTARVYDMIRLLGAYGQSFDGPERQSIAGGVMIVSGNVSLSYCASRPYMTTQQAEQSINAAVSVKL
jgi:hypothetical protein